MSRERIRVGRPVMMLSGITLCLLSLAGCEPFPGKLIENRELANVNFKVRVQVYEEGNKAHFFEPGCHIKFDSAKAAANEWRQFSSAYYSHCDQIPDDQVRFVNADTAYVFMQWWYIVTTDGGVTWSSWDVAGHLSGRVYYNPRLIQDVSVGSDGKGTMILNPEGVRDRKSVTLYTQDFGLHWKEQ